MNQSIEAFQVQRIPLDKLKKSDENVRKVPHTKEEIEALANSIEAHGQIQNLVVKTERDTEGNATGCYLVIAGEGRRLAQVLRMKHKKIGADEPIACSIDDTHSATAVSLAENDLRRPSHPLDQMSAFRALADAGQSVDEIAAQFSVTPLIVKQRLKLANVAPDFIELYRKGSVELSILIALALTDDHAKQLQVWNGLRKYERVASIIRERLTEREIATSDPMVKFVGVKAYIKAGGQVRRDLFAEGPSDGYVMDVELLRRLADEKLTQAADKVKAEGHGWVDVVASLDYSDLAAYGRVQPTRRAPTADETEALAALEAKRQALADEVEEAQEDEERCADLDRQAEAVEADIDLLDRRLEVPSPDQAAVAGAVVTIDGQGKLRVERNLLRPEDKARFARAQRAAQRSVKGEKRVHSSDLVRRLTSHRTLALQAELVQQPMTAAIVLTQQLVLDAFYDSSWTRGALQIEVQPTALKGHQREFEGCEASATLAAHRKVWEERLPDDPDTLLSWLSAQSGSDLLAILAYCVAVTVDGVRSTEGASPLDSLAKLTNLDMRRWWTATSESYFASISKAHILEVVREAVSSEAAAALALLKKAPLAKEAEAKVAKTGWLPPPLRTEATA